MEAYETIPAKTIVTKTKTSAWFGAEYNMNIYRGCSHACIYCDSRSDCYGNQDFDAVKVKENALSLIQKDLRAKRKTSVVATGSMSDPYNPLETSLQLTRQALLLLQQYGFGVAIATKSALITRDIDVLSDLRKQAPVLAKITITTPHDEFSRVLEPYAPLSSERFAAIRALSDAGIFCGILLMPVLPFLTDDADSMLELIRKAKQNGARFIYPAFGVTLRDTQREYYYTKLDTHFPGLKNRYERQYGPRYSCGSPNAKALREIFVRECRANGLLYGMKDIIFAYQKPFMQTQLQLFD